MTNLLWTRTDYVQQGGYYDFELIEWFEKHAPEYPDEFGWWFEEMEDE